jgi:hypothetical protein
LQELKILAFSQVKWNHTFSLGFALSDGQLCEAGSENFYTSYSFDPNLKITRIECMIGKGEYSICRINFYSDNRKLV